jgi:adenylate cyclase
MSNVFEKLLGWQLRARASSGGELHATLHSYCRFLGENGLAVSRATVAMATLHPQIQALRYVWYDDIRDPGPFPSPALFSREIIHLDGCTVDEALMTYGAKDSEPFKRSPFYPVSLGTPRMDFRLVRGANHAYPILDDLAEQGATHYAIFALPGMDAQISLVTRAADGFSDGQLKFLELSLGAFAMLVDIGLKNVILDTVLNCYVGAAPAEEVKRGNIRPGDMLELRGAIWFSDIRNYSGHVRNNPPDVFIGKLNQYYECVVPIIYAHGGDVLKFIGDAVLAIFTEDRADNGRDACRRALAAAESSNRELAARQSEFQHGIGLHAGEFQFGNIGSLQRLDFTVIGNEVNVASRIEERCSSLGERLLMSQAFVDQSGLPATFLESSALKGLPGEFALYAPAAIAKA